MSVCGQCNMDRKKSPFFLSILGPCTSLSSQLQKYECVKGCLWGVCEYTCVCACIWGVLVHMCCVWAVCLYWKGVYVWCFMSKRVCVSEIIVVVCWLLSVPATCQCISGTDLHRQFYVLPHWYRSCRSNFPSHPVTVYLHRADQSQRWPYNARHLAG